VKIGRVFFLLAASGLLSLPAPAADLTLASGGRSDYSIVVPHQAVLAEQHAATELAGFVKQMSGAVLPVVSDDAPLPGHAILLGRNKFLQQLNAHPDWDALGQEGFAIQGRGPISSLPAAVHVAPYMVCMTCWSS